MAFEIYRPDPGQPTRKQGPAKITVTPGNNGRTQVTLSAGTRDWLGPTPGHEGARWPENMPKMKLILLVDRATRKLMLQRCDDDETGDHVYEVRGLSSSGTAYISGWKLEESLGLKGGHYFCELVQDSTGGSGRSARAVSVSLDAGIPPKKRESARQPLGQQPARPSSLEPNSEIERQRIDEIRAVLDEGVTVVAP